MKKSKHTVITALMFTAAAVSLGALSVSCGLYGPMDSEPDSAEDALAYAEPSDPPGQTELQKGD